MWVERRRPYSFSAMPMCSRSKSSAVARPRLSSPAKGEWPEVATAAGTALLFRVPRLGVMSLLLRTPTGIRPTAQREPSGAIPKQLKQARAVQLEPSNASGSVGWKAYTKQSSKNYAARSVCVPPGAIPGCVVGVVSRTATAAIRTMPNNAAHLCRAVRDSSNSPTMAIARNPAMKIIELRVAAC